MYKPRNCFEIGNVYDEMDFNLSPFIYENACSSNMLECPLCCKARNVFYCKDCINNGDYFRSTAPLVYRYADKRLALLQLKKKKKDTEIKCEKLLQSRLLKIKLMGEIEEHKERIKLLRCLVKKSQEVIVQKKAKVSELDSANVKSLNDTIPFYKGRVNRLRMYVLYLMNNRSHAHQELVLVQGELRKVTKARIQELIKCVFPISVKQPSRCEDNSEPHDLALYKGHNKDTAALENKLRDAATLSYVAGRWVTTDISGQLHHCIVAPTLPASGNYSAYNDWVKATKDGVIPVINVNSVQQNQAYNISAALTYTTQLVNLLAEFLGVLLPHKLKFSDLCCTALSEDKFSRRVNQLNLNVLHLCLTQNVNPDLLHPDQTLQNIIHLLEAPGLGRMGPLEVEPWVTWELEDGLRANLGALSENSDIEEDDNDSLPQEWEAVPHMSNLEVSAGPPPPTNSHHAASALAASLASFWRGLTTNR